MRKKLIISTAKPKGSLNICRPLQCWICAVEIPRNSFLTHLQEEELLVRHDRSFVVSGFEIAANDKHYLSDGR